MYFKFAGVAVQMSQVVIVALTQNWWSAHYVFGFVMEGHIIYMQKKNNKCTQESPRVQYKLYNSYGVQQY